jgi:hypothetical protein
VGPHGEIARLVRRVEHDREPDLRIVRKRVQRRHHADDRERAVVESDGCANRRRRSTEPRLPEGVTHQGHAAVEASALLVRAERPAENRPDSQRLFETVALQHDAQPRRHLATQQRHAVAAHRHDRVERRRVLAKGENVSGGHVERMRKPVGAGNLIAEPQKPVGIGERQRPQQHMVDCAEHRGVGADPEGENGDRKCRIARRAAEQAQRVPAVVPKVVDHGSRTDSCWWLVAGYWLLVVTRRQLATTRAVPHVHDHFIL